MIRYYDKHLEPVTLMAWAYLMDDASYKRVAETTLPNGQWVSTVWVGLDHQFGEGPPLIFESMVFPNTTEFSELDVQRYHTEAEALAGHAALCEKWKSP